MEKPIITLQHKRWLTENYASCTLYEDRVVLKTWNNSVWGGEDAYTNKERAIYIRDISSIIVQEPKTTFNYNYYGYLQFHAKGNTETLIESRADLLSKKRQFPNIIDAGGILLMFKGKEQQIRDAMTIKRLVEQKIKELSKTESTEKHQKFGTGDSNSNVLEELERLSALYSKGLLTEEEFKMAKQRLLFGK